MQWLTGAVYFPRFLKSKNDSQLMESGEDIVLTVTLSDELECEKVFPVVQQGVLPMLL